MSKRPTIESFREKALQNPDVKAEYDSLSAAFQMKRQMIALRKKAGKTQAEMADLLGTKRSNISRLESGNSDVSPRLATVEEYAKALGYTIKVEFEPNPKMAGSSLGCTSNHYSVCRGLSQNLKSFFWCGNVTISDNRYANFIFYSRYRFILSLSGIVTGSSSSVNSERLNT